MNPEQVKSTRAWRTMGLSDAEYDRIRGILGRDPNWVELGMFAVLWSEHCAYKHSRAVLRQFPTAGSRVLVGPGENAGVMDIGDGLAVAAKIESHNHPCAIEPYQGAATGVGGIIRDILSMGARPVALLDSLRFGPLTHGRARFIFDGVVGGIAGYGNCVGIPTVAGDVYFEEPYTENPLCNVMCVGLVVKDRLIRGVAAGPGNTVMLVGARTGRDGIHGATFASEELREDAEERRPSVQVGDPFLEKQVIEACLELIETGAVVGIQDMGAAGITSSCAETASRAGTGIEIDVALVPRREEGMTPYEVMLSESQERMLVVVRRGKEETVRGVCRKWGLQAAAIGTVTADGMFRVRENGVVVAEVPARALTEEAPLYHPEAREPAYLKETRVDPAPSLPEPDYPGEILARLLASPNIAAKEWVYQQYDHMVRTNTVVLPGDGAAVLRVKGTRRGVALKTDGNGRYCYLDPYTGGAIAVAEAARNVTCAGAEPIGLTNCLNFGNPEKAEVFWQFQETVAGMAAACRALGIPVTGGNVSFYNETKGRAVYPTPVVGMVGLLEDIRRLCRPGFRAEGDAIVLLGETFPELGGSEYLAVVGGRVAGMPPRIDLERERRVQGCCREAIRAGLVRSAHDCAEGGLAVALAECCFRAVPGARGARVELDGGIRLDALLFGESQSRIVVTVSPGDIPALRAVADRWEVPLAVIGRVEPPYLRIAVGGRTGWAVDRLVADLERFWLGAIETAGGLSPRGG